MSGSAFAEKLLKNMTGVDTKFADHTSKKKFIYSRTSIPLVFEVGHSNVGIFSQNNHSISNLSDDLNHKHI